MYKILPISVLLLACAPAAVVMQGQSAEGVQLLDAGKAAEARDAFESVLRSDPANAAAQEGEVEASEQLSLEAQKAGNPDDALRALMRAQEFAPRNARLSYDLGILEERLRLFQDAEKSLGAAAQLGDKDPRIIYAIARVKMDLGQLDAAAEKMKEYLAIRPSDATAHFGLGRIYQVGLDSEKARTEFSRSIELQPAQTESYYELGDLALKQGDFDEALAEFQKTLMRNPQHGGALEGSGEVCFKQKRYDEAREFLERAVAAAPDYSPCHYYLGLTLARLGRKEDSERELATAAKLADAVNKKEAQHPQLITPQTKP